ncbi:SPOR domain-containing protein [Chitinibacter sp. S2-10]|uniref:SPOR domain-containing protein n=1 Tax=Chitinibacter sp. S2-10 TaxID=3373597 RepID=UPI003977A092
MKLFFALLLLANLLVYGWFQLDSAPMSITLQTREKNASAVKIVTGTLGENAGEASATAAAPTEPTPTTPIPTASAAPTPVTLAQHCARWTGVTGDQIQLARDRLSALKMTMTETSSGESTKVWVYIPPQDSLEIAKSKAAQLAELGLKDYFVVNNGGRWQNAISLGVFSTREAGERHLAELQAQGVKSAVVRDRDDTLKQATFNFKQLSDEQLARLNKLSLQFRGSVVREQACK